MRITDLISLDWEVGLFRAVSAMARLVRPVSTPWATDRVVQLAPIAGQLGHLASLVAKEPLRVIEARGDGGVRGHELLFPPFLDLAPTPDLNRGLYVLRAVHAATIRRLGFDRLPIPEGAEDRHAAELRVVVQAAREASEELPRFAEAWEAACRLCLLARPELSTLSGAPLRWELARQVALGAHHPPASPGKDRGESPPIALWGGLLPCADTAAGTESTPAADGTVHDAPPVDAVHRVTVKEQDVALQHSFEKVETIEPFHGIAPKVDGTDELDDELEALRDADLGAMLRGGPEAHAMLRAEIGGADVGDLAVDEEGPGVPYDEWDGRRREWRRDWCTVLPHRLMRRDPAWTAAALARNRRTIVLVQTMLERQLTARRMVTRQADGEEVDIDALVDSLSLRRTGRDEERVYLRSQRRTRDLAVMVLMDISLSSDAWIGDHRVLDITRDAVLVMGEVAHALGDAFAVSAFASVTRAKNHVYAVKDWKDPWPVARDRLGVLEPEGYTRIGAAIRHTTASLAARQARRRLLLVLTDGRPTDYDRYEGPYGLADVRMALRQAEAAGITPYGLAIDTSAREGLRAMFGNGGWELLSDPAALPAALTKVYGRHSLA